MSAVVLSGGRILGSGGFVYETGLALGGGSTLIFNYPSGFSGVTGNFSLAGSTASFSGAVMQVVDGSAGQHEASAVWYTNQVNISSFSTDFTFQIPATGTVPSIIGMTFCVQNSNITTNPNDTFGAHWGLHAATDANVSGFGAFTSNTAQGIGNAIAIKFDIGANSAGQVAYPPGGSPSATGLYLNGGPYAALVPQQDLNPYGINLNLGNVMSCHVDYDGSLLTMQLTDTSTLVKCRYSWPINLQAICGGNLAWVGFTAGEVPGGSIPFSIVKVLSWTLYDGSSTRYSRLSTPTFSVTPGRYTSTQTVSLSGSAGASIYYTTNGLLPTSASTLYTAAITVSASQVIQAVAVQTGFTDSLIAVGNYQIAAGGTPLINFPSNFSGASGLVIVNGSAQYVSNHIKLVESSSGANREIGSAWYAVPVPITTFTTNFTVIFGSGSSNGMTFCVQNFPPTSTNTGGSQATGANWIIGGPNATANDQNGFGYSGNTAGSNGQNAGLLYGVAVKLDPANNATGLYVGGAAVNSPQTTISGLSLSSGNPIAVQLIYNGTNMSVSITDTVTTGNFTTSFAVNLTSSVGGNTAYVGFTGSQYFAAVDQTLTTWTYATP
jgi:Chitobiase/beta-hexosaminidase C-terminal domain/Legume lectin domain